MILVSGVLRSQTMVVQKKWHPALMPNVEPACDQEGRVRDLHAALNLNGFRVLGFRVGALSIKVVL